MILKQVGAIALNTYRENVRARLLHGLFAVALATAGYSLIVGAYAFRDTLRVVSDLGAASVSLYAVVVSVVLGAASLHRELELKTAFPILARPVRRGTYLLGKFLGAWLTLVVFVMANVGVLLLATASLAGVDTSWIVGVVAGAAVPVVWLARKVRRSRTYLPLLWSACTLVGGYLLAQNAMDDRRVLVYSAILTVCEVGVVIAIANFFASFSSPFLSAVLTLGVVVVGRSADTLGALPARVFGSVISAVGRGLSVSVPNLMVYVPARTLLTGEAKGTEILPYLASAAVQAVGWAMMLLVVATVIFKRRDFV